MNIPTSYFKQLETPTHLVIVLIIAAVIHSCKSDKRGTLVAAAPDVQVVDILTQDMEFQMPDTIMSGWNTFRYNNASPQTHFFLIDKYPEGITLKQIKDEVIPVFDNGMKLINEGKEEEGYAEFGNLPEWFSQVEFLGGSGFISPDHVAQTTVKLDPGFYFVECYIKMSNGVFHTSMGMIKELIVSDAKTENTEPEADIPIEISSTEGIVFKDSISVGQHTFSVYFKDQIVHEHFLGHDVSLARLDDKADLGELDRWMNWADPKGLVEPAPNGVTFLGGVNNMPEGNKGYFTANLEPGRYTFISEVPNPTSKNMLKVFTVTE